MRRLLLAVVDDVAVGMLDTIVVPNLTRKLRPWAAILRAMRRHGVGRLLMEKAIEHARDRGCYKIQLVSAQARDEAHALYRASGFDADLQGYRRYLISPGG